MIQGEELMTLSQGTASYYSSGVCDIRIYWVGDASNSVRNASKEKFS